MPIVVQVFTTPGADISVAPANAVSADIECWAGGAGAGDGLFLGNGGGGGGGGAYSKTLNFPVTPGTPYGLIVANGGAAVNHGEDSSFDAVCFAQGGRRGAGVSGGIGGSAAMGIGDILFNGGDGANAPAADGGGGGGGAGSLGDGGVAAASLGGLGQALDGGNGGDGATLATANQPGSIYGGGGGGGAGSISPSGGEVGAQGQVIVTYTTIIPINRTVPGLLSSQYKVATGYYNFAINGGAVGVYRTGIFLPKNTTVYGFWITEKTNLTGNALCLISFGNIQTGVAAPASDINSFCPLQAISSFATNVPRRVIDLDLNPVFFDTAQEVIMTIDDFPITGGSLQFDICYQYNG